MSSNTNQGIYSIKEGDLSLNGIALSDISSEEIKTLCLVFCQEGLEKANIEFENGNIISILKEKDQLLISVQNDHSSAQTETESATEDKQNPLADIDVTDMGAFVWPKGTELNPPSDTAQVHASLLEPVTAFEQSYHKAELFYEPLEAPGGDFYSFHKYSNDLSLAVVGDCTGHGLQGAMIGMSVMTMLKQYFSKPPKSLIDATYEFYDLFNTMLKKDGDNGGFDFEIGFVLYDKKKGLIEYTGSGVNLIVKSESESTAYTTKMRMIANESLPEQKIYVHTGEQLILYTDGIIDQFDALDKKKMGSRGLRSLFEDLILPTSIEEFKKKFEAFRGETKALDDQTLLLLSV